MATYTFHPFRADGIALTFLCAEPPDDTAAFHYARGVFDAHASAEAVAVSEGDRQIGSVGAGSTPVHARVLNTSRKRIAASLDLLQRAQQSANGG